MLVLSPFIISGTQAFKKAGIPSVYLPLIAILLGALLVVGFYDFSIIGGIQGIVIGAVTAYNISMIDDRLEKIKNPAV